MLTDNQRAELRTLIGAKNGAARTLTRARILLKVDHGDGGPGWSEAAITGALDVNASTVLRVRRQFVTDGLAAALHRKRPDRVYDHRLDGEAEARLIAIACSTPPDSLARWSLRLLADSRAPHPVTPGVPARADPEYIRGGVTHLFLVTKPLCGWRHVTVGPRRTRLEFAQCVKEVVDTHFPDADRIVLVMDQLNTHSTLSLYATFPPEEARRLAARLEIHDTPKHGSCLNMAERELSVLARQCLTQRLPDQSAMATAVTAWATRRNAAIHTIDWQFTTDDSRARLRRLY